MSEVLERFLVSPSVQAFHRVAKATTPLAFLIACICSTAPAASLRTVDGRSYEGDVRFDADGTLMMQPRRGSPVKVAPANLLQLTLRSAEAPKPALKLVLGQLPPPWQAEDIGRILLAGSAHFLGDAFLVKAAGIDINGRHDSFYFLYQSFHGDGQIVAHVRDLSARHERAKAGVMFRETLDPESRMMTLVTEPLKGSAFCQRPGPGEEMVVVARGAKIGRNESPGWLLLSRRGNVFSAATSIDGSHWDTLGREEIPMARGAYIGLCVASHDANALCDAAFDQVTIGSPNDTPQPAAPPSGPVGYSKAVVLKSGTVLGNATVTGVTEQVVQLNDAFGKHFSIPLTDIARLTFLPLTSAALARIPEHTAGVLKVNGDFVEGEFAGFDGYRIKLSSVLFGLQTLPIREEAAALVLRDPEPLPAPFTVRTTNGSLYLAQSLKFDRDLLGLDEQTLGACRLPASQLMEIKAGGGRFVWLSVVKPSKIEPPPGFAQADAWSPAGTVAGRAPTLDGTPCDHAIRLAAGGAVSYALQGQYKLLLCRCGVPDTVLPTAAVRLVILADNREIYRSPPRTSLDEPATLSLSVAGAQTLSLRVESAAPFPVPAVWGEAELVK